MGLWDFTTANVLRRKVAQFVLEPRPRPKRNELLEGPRIPDYEVLRKKYSIPVRRVPYPSKLQMSLELEPTKTGAEMRPKTRTWTMLDETMMSSKRHSSAQKAPMRPLENDVFEWEVDTVDYTAFLVAGEGFFANNALCNPEVVTNFLLDPVAVCKDEYLLHNTRVQDASMSRGEPAPRPGRLPMAVLFSKVHRALDNSVEDPEWRRVRRAALDFLLDFAQEPSPPHVRIAPVRTMLAAAFFSVLFSTEGNIPCSIVISTKSGSVDTLSDFETNGMRLASGSGLPLATTGTWPPRELGTRQKSCRNTVVFKDFDDDGM